jgi:hypothetical protein
LAEILRNLRDKPLPSSRYRIVERVARGNGFHGKGTRRHKSSGKIARFARRKETMSINAILGELDVESATTRRVL